MSTGCVQSFPCHPNSLPLVLVPYIHLRPGLPSGLFLLGFEPKTLYEFFLSTCELTASPLIFISYSRFACLIPRRNFSWRKVVALDKEKSLNSLEDYSSKFKDFPLSNASISSIAKKCYWQQVILLVISVCRHKCCVGSGVTKLVSLDL